MYKRQVESISFINDIMIVIKTVCKIFKRADIADDTNAIEGNLAEIRRIKAEV